MSVSGSPLSHIESKEGVQGGKYCLRGTRVPLESVIKSLDSGTTVSEQVAALKKYFSIEISEDALTWAVLEYRMEILNEKLTKKGGGN